MSVWIGESIGDIDIGLLSTWFITEHGTVGDATWRAPGCFNLRMMEGPFLEIHGTSGIERKAVDRVVRIRRIETMDDSFFNVVFVITVRVFEKQQIGSLRDQDTAVPEFEAGRIMNVTGERDALVGFAVLIRIFQDQQTVVHGRRWFPVRIGWPGGNPETPLGIERHLHGINQLRKHRFVSK